MNTIKLESQRRLMLLGQALGKEGMIRGSGGNLSIREEDRIIITATGAKLGQMQERELVALSLDGTPLRADGARRSSEWAFHVAAYRVRPQAKVVIHAHPPKAIALGILGHAFPALTPDQYLHLGARVPLVPYLTPTTRQLANAVTEALKSAPAALLQNHGVVVTGTTIQQARLRLTLLEEGCAIYLDALPLGTPRTLSQQDMHALDEITGGRYKMR